MRKRTKWGRNLMDAYTAFAQVYDLFMDNVPYEQWCAYITGILREHDITEGPILDLGCGTGELTRLLAAEGYDLTGVDSSPEMLQEALAGQRGQEHIVVSVVPHQFVNVPPGGYTYIALLALGHQLAVALAEHLHIH